MIDRDDFADLMQLDRSGEIIPERLVPISQSRRHHANRGAGDDELAVLPGQAAFRRIGVHWLLQARIVRGPVDGPVFGKTIDMSPFLSPSPETAVVEIAGDANGAAAGFGLRLRRALEAQSGDLLQRAGDGKLVEVTIQIGTSSRRFPLY